MLDFIKKNYKRYEEIINYVLVGGMTTVVSIASYYGCAKALNISYMTSTVISWILAVTFAYFTNKIFVFKSKNRNFVKEIIEFFKYRILSLIIEMIVMYVLVDLFRVDDGISKILVQFIVLVLNYIFSKIFVFKNKEV